MLSDGVREIPPLLSMTTGCLSLVFSLTIYMKLHLEVILPYALFILIAGALYYFRDGNGPGSQGKNFMLIYDTYLYIRFY